MTLFALLVLARGGVAQQPAAPVPINAMVGQQVALMPITLIAADPALRSDTAYAPYRERRAALSWADSLIGEAFVARAPEVQWVLPPDLRKIARRAPGMVGDPDRMGQAMVRSSKLRELPDPLRSSLRNLMAVVGGRVVMIPASLGFGRQADGLLRADLTLVAADVRTGRILWRSAPAGSGTTPREALEAALAEALPLDVGGP